MRLTLLRLLVNTLVILLTTILMPGIVVDRSAPLPVFVVIGFIFGVVNTFIRPLAIIAAGRLVIRSMGLFLIVINALMLLIVDMIQRLFGLELWTFKSIVTLFIAGLIIGLLMALMDILFGLNRPMMEDMRERDLYWRWISRLPTMRRNRIIENLRFQQVFDTVWRYLLDILFSGGVLGSIRAYIGSVFFPPDLNKLEALSAPSKVRVMLQELGPTYVKIGQILSSRSEALPPDWQAELSKLQSNVAPFSSSDAREIIAEELGRPVEELYESFDDEVLAAASTAQIHRANLKDGTEVVVKVQRPYIVPIVNADLGVLQDSVETMERYFSWARNNDFAGIFETFADNVRQELNYDNEAYQARRLKYNMAVYPHIQVPTIYGAFSTSKVLTMAFVQGVKVTDVEAIDEAGLDRAQLADVFVRAMLKQLLVDGFFHGDPHPGNVLVNLDTGSIIFLDLGMMGTLSREQRMDLIDLLWSINAQDSHELASVLLRLSTPFKDVNEAEFRRGVDRLVAQFMLFSEESNTVNGVMSAALGLMYDTGLRLQNELTIAIKALGQLEEIVTTLNKDIFLVNVAMDEVRRLLLDEFNVDTVTDQLKVQAVRSSKEVIRRIPSLQQATMKWLDQYEKGQFTVNLDAGDLTKQVSNFNSGLQLLTVGLILVGMMLASALAVWITSSAGVENLAATAFYIFVGTLLLGTYMVFRLLAGLRRRRRK